MYKFINKIKLYFRTPFLNLHLILFDSSRRIWDNLGED